MIKLAISSTLSAFAASTIGTKIVDEKGFMEEAGKAIEQYDSSKDRQPGQHFVVAPGTIPYVSAGVGKRTNNPEDYVLRSHRGRIETYLRREVRRPLSEKERADIRFDLTSEHGEMIPVDVPREEIRKLAAPVDSCNLIVYTRQAYLADPDVQKDGEELRRIQDSDCTHVLVAVLASAGPKPPLTPFRFVHNLAGGNNEAKGWTADEIRSQAEVILAYDKVWCVVADLAPLQGFVPFPRIEGSFTASGWRSTQKCSNLMVAKVLKSRSASFADVDPSASETSKSNRISVSPTEWFNRINLKHTKT